MIRRVCFLSGVVALAGFAVQPSNSLGQRAPAPNSVVARVNGVAIDTRALQQLLDGVLSIRQDAAADPRRLRELEREALESLIDFELLFQESQRVGIRVRKETIAAELQRAEEKLGGAQAYAEVLRERGWTRSDVERDTERALAVQLLLETVVWKHVRVAKEEVLAFYQRHRNEFHRPEQVRLRHILVPVADRESSEEWQDALERARQFRARVVAGEDFASVARQASADRDTATTGGDLGWIARSELDGELEQAVQTLEVGAVSQPLRSRLGYHVVQVLERRPEQAIPFQQARKQIEEILLRRERQRRQREFTRSLRTRAVIEYTALSGHETPAAASP